MSEKAAASPPVNLEGFVCQRCNECCRQPGFVALEEADVDRLALHLKMPLYDFTARYCEIKERRQLVLKKRPDESCIFLSAKGCDVHPAKPQQCRDFPYRWRTQKSMQYCRGLRALVQSAAK